jgi:hypothetical protein
MLSSSSSGSLSDKFFPWESNDLEEEDKISFFKTETAR